jgi:hypothetical protein
MIRIVRLTLLVVLVVSVAAVGQIAHAGVRIGGSSLRANGQVAQGHEYTGPCPVDLKFSWGVIATDPTEIRYTFSRNDGGHSSGYQSASLPPNRSVPIYDDWRLGANTPKFADYRGWVQINIMGPNRVEQMIPFTIHCR